MRAVFLNSRELIDQHWWSVAHLLDGRIDQVSDEYTLQDLAAMVEAGTAFAGLALDDEGAPVLAMVFRFVHYPRAQTVHIMAMGGSHLAEVAVTFWRQFTQWAKESGATRIEACALPAMTRVLRSLGFEHRYNHLRIEV
ncbi:hypothetical protein O4H66_17335 [Comamonadaceae bacterium G21597-S1]|nr:hypothetical protein [Comamonadaceae bacterium G21597-S1]